MERGPLPQVNSVWVLTPPAGPVPTTFVGNDGAWRFLVLLLACTALAGGTLFACWRLLGKDLLLTLKARRSRTVTELGFGQTPPAAVRAGAGVQQLGQIG
ncbi:movement protein [Urochloa decumbens associated virus]